MGRPHGLSFALRIHYTSWHPCLSPPSGIARWQLHTLHSASHDRASPQGVTKLQEPMKQNAEHSPEKRIDTNPLSKSVRLLMRTQPHSLCAVVSSDASNLPAQQSAPLSALLVSSFNTVTLSPRPYVSFNIKTPSTTLDAIRASRSFTVSGLGQKAVAEAFVTSRAKAKEEWVSLVGAKGEVTGTAGGRWWMRCEYQSEMDMTVGDHVIVVGEVVELGAFVGDNIESEGLIYLDGKYRRIGRET